ncbi:MAG: glycine betaine/proline transport system permease protein, partial [Cellvibrionaceae bacterium]
MSMSDIKTSDELLRGNSDQYAKEREARIPEFVKTNQDYYLTQFKKIGSSAEFTWTFNLWAGILGPIWFSARSIWSWGLSFLLLEIFAIVQIVRGLFG